MNQIEQAIKAVEDNLHIHIQDFAKAPPAHVSQYFELDEELNFIQFSELHFENFEALKPIFTIVKTLWFSDCTFNANNIVKGIEQFTELESIELLEGSIEVIQAFLKIKTIKSLNIYIDYDVIPLNSLILDFSGLKSIKSLLIHSNNVSSDKIIVFKGAEYLTNLEKLVLECDCLIDDLNKFKSLRYLHTENIQLQITDKLESLKTLIFDVTLDDFKIYSLEQFPNLENLKIIGSKVINLGNLDKLKRLVINSSEFDLATTNCFNNLPNLEELELYTPKNPQLKSLAKLFNLKSLNLMNNETIENIDGIKHMKNLEYLNLYKNQISDINVLNELPNLKEVNVAKNKLTQENVEEYLEKPEIAFFNFEHRRPVSNIPFCISDNFE